MAAAKRGKQKNAIFIITQKEEEEAMNASRASSVNASSHLVTSRHDAKCRRVPRIISRRFYSCRRRKSSLQPPQNDNNDRYSSPNNNRDFSPGALDLPCLEETILRFLIKYPKRRSYSTDSDPLAVFRSAMNKSVFFNHCLMKRRYSVPETVMRKHKLQENLSKKKSTTAKNEKMENVAQKDDEVETSVKDESCQTEACFDYMNRLRYHHNSFKRSSRCRKRENLRYFKKTNSYCQYRSLSMYHKNMYDSTKTEHDDDKLDDEHEQRLKCLNNGSPKKVAQYSSMAASTIPLIGTNITKSKSEKAIAPTKKLNPIVRQNSYPPPHASTDQQTRLFCGTDRNLNNIKKSSLMRNNVIVRPKITLPGHDKQSDPPRKAFLGYSKSIDQNTSGYNTVCGSLDETPRRKTPETPKLSTSGNDQPPGNAPSSDNEKKFGSFPITFHSESVFVHPYENGFLSHKELHHISIQLVADSKVEKTSGPDMDDFFDAEVKLKVPVTETSTSTQQSHTSSQEKREKGGGEPPAKTLSDISEKSIDKEDRIEQTPPYIVETEANETPRDSDDCAVPITNNFCSLKTEHEPTKLKIEVDVPSIELSRSLQEILQGRKVEEDQMEVDNKRKQKSPVCIDCNSDKYNSKTALNYLFQKLGSTYPKRCLLKHPTFPDYSREGKYYSDLLLSGNHAEMPHTVHYNNQTYDILSGNLLPNEWSNTATTVNSRHPLSSYHNVTVCPNLSQLAADNENSGDSNNEHLSDSDISIPDSLEDFQQHTNKLKHHNKYNKYDERLTRGDVVFYNTKSCKQPRKYRKSISYFVPFGESKIKSVSMPAKLRERLRVRNKNLSKHALCINAKKKTAKRGKMIHKQIQTSPTSENGAKWRRQNMKPSSRANLPQIEEYDLDEKIMDILLKGLKLQEEPNIGHETNKSPQQGGNENNDEIGSKLTHVDNQTIVSEYVEMYRVTAPAGDEIPANVSEQSDFFRHDNNTLTDNKVFEVTLNKEEISRINATNYFKSIKKSRQIFYPRKAMMQKQPNESSIVDHVTSAAMSSQQNQNIPSFSKYQKKLREFKQQIRKQNSDKINPLLSSGSGDDALKDGNSSSTTAGLQQLRMKKLWREKHKMKNSNCKIPGMRFNRFHQRFEAIPEEMSNNLEGSDHNYDSMQTMTKHEEIEAVNRSNIDENKNIKSEENQTSNVTNVTKAATMIKEQLEETNETKIITNMSQENNINENEYKDELKSQKGRNSLCTVREQEELITLSRGWINFYLLNGNNAEDDETADEIEEEKATHSETSRIPQQYTVHVHAKPQSSTANVLKTSTLPGLCKISNNQSSRTEKFNKQIDKTVLPDISHVSSRHNKTYNSNLRNFRVQNALPKLHQSDESDTGKKADMELTTAEPVISQDICAKEMPLSGPVASSVHSESSADEISERNRTKKLHRYHRPHTYHATRASNQWSLTIEGKHGVGEKRESDIEMQLFVKNKNNGNPNQSWKFSITNEEMSQTQGYPNVNKGYLPHLNVNYKMLPFPIYHDDSASYSENNSRCNSAMSCRNVRNTGTIKDRSSLNARRFSGDMKLQIRRSEDDLTVTGSAITPERKPKAPTMSERDLNRMKLIRQTSIENKTT